MPSCLAQQGTMVPWDFFYDRTRVHHKLDGFLGSTDLLT